MSSATQLQFVDPRNPINRINPAVLEKLVAAQTSLIQHAYKNAGDLLATVLEATKIDIQVPPQLFERPVTELTDVQPADLTRYCGEVLKSAGAKPQVITHQAQALSERVQLVRAFENPDDVIASISETARRIVATFPRNAADIERGKNPGDVFDPYILVASMSLLFRSDLEGAITAAASHKALMKIEDLLGGLHQYVIGRMRGNVRAPEPRGLNKEILDPFDNPFPGADVVQPPFESGGSLRFHQVKSKTGSAKGGDAKRLGEQLQRLKATYHGEIYYDALVGNTLKGHRSMGGAMKVAPDLVVLVGNSAFRILTHSEIGPILLLRLYQAAFEIAAAEANYSMQAMSAAIFKEFEERVTKTGKDFFSLLVSDVIGGEPKHQDSRRYKPGRLRGEGDISLL